MDLQEIDVFIEKNGQVRLEVRGVKGSRCLELTQELEKVLGGQILSRELTAESNEVPDQAKNQNWLYEG